MRERWKTKRLGDICHVIGGGTPSKSNAAYFEGDIPWATVRDMNYDILRLTEHKITHQAVKNSSANIIPKKNVIIATRVGLGKVCLLESDTAINQDLKGIIPKDRSTLDVNFLYLWFKSISKQIVNEGTGATVQGVKLPFIKNLLIPLPNLSEQQRIVSILDEAFAAIAKAKENAEKNLRNAKELFETYLQRVFENKGEGWENVSLGEICKINDGTHFSPKNTSAGEYMYITAKNIKPYRIDLKNITYISEKDHKEIYSRCSPKKGDVLYIKDGATAGIAAINTFDEEFSLLSSVALFKCSERISNSFLVHYMNSSTGRKNFLGYIDGAAITRLTLIKLKNVFISLPPYEIQVNLVKKIDILFQETIKLERIYQQKLSNLEELKKTILQKAFAGELTHKEIPEMI